MTCQVHSCENCNVPVAHAKYAGKWLCVLCADDTEAHDPASSCATVILSVCQQSMDRWWSQLNLDKKAEIFAQHFDCCG